jgi:hypothetical protein
LGQREEKAMKFEEWLNEELARHEYILRKYQENKQVQSEMLAGERVSMLKQVKDAYNRLEHKSPPEWLSEALNEGNGVYEP